MFKLPADTESVESEVTYSGTLAEYEKELLFDSEITFQVKLFFENDGRN